MAVEYIPGLPYTISYRLLTKLDGSYDEQVIDLLRRFSAFNDIVILLPDTVDNKSALKLVDYLRSKRVRAPQVTYIVYTPLISDRDELEVIVESM